MHHALDFETVMTGDGNWQVEKEPNIAESHQLNIDQVDTGWQIFAELLNQSLH